MNSTEFLHESLSTKKNEGSITRVCALVLLAGILALFGTFLVHQYHSGLLGHDQMSYLFEAQRFLGGAEIYGPTISETNPPVIIWFSVPAVVLAQKLSLEPYTTFRAIVAALMLITTLWCTFILYRTRPKRITNVLSLGLFASSIVWALFAIGAYEFGQREHLFVIFILPYVFATASLQSPLSRWERCAIGICAAIAVWFKPHQLLGVIALEIFSAIKLRSLRRIVSAEVVSFVATCFAILLLVFVATPLYRTDTLPLLFDCYWALSKYTAFGLARASTEYFRDMAIIIPVWWLLRRRFSDPSTSIVLLLSSIVGFVSYAIQQTDWQYHRYPYRAFLLLAIAYIGIDLLSSYFVRLSSPRRLIAFATAALLLCALSGPYNNRQNNVRSMETDPVYSHLAPGTTVYTISTGVNPLASAYYYHLEWGGRFAHLWMLPAIIQNESGRKIPFAPFKRLPPEKVKYLADLQRRQTTEDLNRWHPSMVIVERCTVKEPCGGLEGKNVDFLEWFKRSPDFAATWSHYERRSETLPRFDVYALRQ